MSIIIMFLKQICAIINVKIGGMNMGLFFEILRSIGSILIFFILLVSFCGYLIFLSIKNLKESYLLYVPMLILSTISIVIFSYLMYALIMAGFQV